MHAVYSTKYYCDWWLITRWVRKRCVVIHPCSSCCCCCCYCCSALSGCCCRRSVLLLQAVPGCKGARSVSCTFICMILVSRQSNEWVVWQMLSFSPCRLDAQTHAYMHGYAVTWSAYASSLLGRLDETQAGYMPKSQASFNCGKKEFSRTCRN